MKIYLSLLLGCLSLVGCNKNSSEDSDYAYFGGEIVNPNNNYVILNSPDNKSDTIYLDKNNRFIKKLTFIKSGLYTFIHGGEYQSILLESSDSIMLTLNTIDFDESLVFSGEGARKNNYLISTFLKNEVDNKKFMRMMWDMEPTKFEQILNEDRRKKLDELNTFLAQKEYSDLFKDIASCNINYDYYYNKELYPFGYYGYNNLIHYKDLPEGFYDYRTEIDYNNEDLTGVIPYYKFLFYHFNNLALGEYYKNATHNVVFDNESVVYNLEKLRLMDSLISNSKIKNHLLKLTTRDFIAVNQDSSETNEILISFLDKNNSEEDKKYIKKLVVSLNKLKTGNEIPNVKLINYDDVEVDIISLIKKPTVVYFWSTNLPLLLRNSHYKVNSLQSKYPEIDFIAININDDDRSHWKNMINQYKFSLSCEYQFLNPKEAMDDLAINSVNRSILVDGDGKIISSNAMIFTSEFEDELNYLLNKKKASK